MGFLSAINNRIEIYLITKGGTQVPIILNKKASNISSTNKKEK
jgi:hypothetical protein